jgi:hypothetical protein
MEWSTLVEEAGGSGGSRPGVATATSRPMVWALASSRKDGSEALTC